MSICEAVCSGRDWIQAVEDSYVPMQVAPALWIIPTHAQIQDPSALNIIMRPGMAFGTGTPLMDISSIVRFACFG